MRTKIVRRDEGLFALADQLEVPLAKARRQVAALTPSGRMHAIKAHGVSPGLNINELKLARRNLVCPSQSIPIGQIGGDIHGVTGGRDTIETKLELAGRVDDGVRENRLGQ